VKVGDLVWVETSDNKTWGSKKRLGTVVNLSYTPQNGKSSDYVDVFIHELGKVTLRWRSQVWPYDEVDK